MTDTTPEKTNLPEANQKKQTSRIILNQAAAPMSKFETKQVPIAPGMARAEPVSDTAIKAPKIDLTDIKSSTTVVRKLSSDPAAAKRETSRIILRDTPIEPESTYAKQATAPITGIPVTPTGGIPQTIRLKRPSTAKISTRPVEAAPALAADKTPSKKPLTQTSRIILEQPTAVPVKPAAPTPPEAAHPIPKTIRLKKPADPLTLKPETLESEKAKTAKIDLPAGVVDAATPASITQRKTIKIKRAERQVTPQTLVLKRSAPKTADKPPTDKTPKPDLQPAKETETIPEPLPGLTFAIIAALALLCIICLAYLMAAQSLHLPFPGKTIL